MGILFLNRRAWALAGFHTRMRAGSPRHASASTNDRGGQAPALRYPWRALAGDRPPRYGPGKTLLFTVGLGPSQVSTRACERVPLASVRVPQRSRGTGPRATGSLAHVRGGQAPALRAWENAPLYRRARACPSPPLGHPNDRGGQGHALRAWKNAPFTVGRGPVPRHRASTREIAGDRPPRYGIPRGHPRDGENTEHPHHHNVR